MNSQMKWCIEHCLAVSQAQGASVPVELETGHLKAQRCVHLLRNSEAYTALGFLWRLNLKEWLIINSIFRASPNLRLDIYRGSIGMIDDYIQEEEWREAEGSKIMIIFWWRSHLEAIKSHLVRTEDTPITQGEYQVLSISTIRNSGQRLLEKILLASQCMPQLRPAEAKNKYIYFK